VILGSTAMACGPDPASDRLWGRESEAPLVLRSPADLLAGGNALVASSVLVRRGIVLAVGGFREAMARGADLDLWLRVLEHGTGYVSPAVTVRYRLHEGQVSGDRGAMWSAHDAIVESYRDRPWCDDLTRRRAAAVLEWDRLRDELGRGDRGAAARRALAVGRDPEQAATVLRLVAARARLRRRSGRYGRDGRPSVGVWADSPAAAAWARQRYGARLRAGPADGVEALRRPPGVTVTDSRARALIARLGGSRPVRVRVVEES
jgi:hypothetical protein